MGRAQVSATTAADAAEAPSTFTAPERADASGGTAAGASTATPAPAARASAPPRVSELLRREEEAPHALSPSQQLLAAATQGRPKLMIEALERGAPPNAADAAGRTALMLAAMRGDDGMVRVLLAAGADRARHDQRGASAADYARRAGHEALARRLEPAATSAPEASKTP